MGRMRFSTVEEVSLEMQCHGLHHSRVTHSERISNLRNITLHDAATDNLQRAKGWLIFVAKHVGSPERFVTSNEKVGIYRHFPS